MQTPSHHFPDYPLPQLTLPYRQAGSIEWFTASDREEADRKRQSEDRERIIRERIHESEQIIQRHRGLDEDLHG